MINLTYFISKQQTKVIKSLIKGEEGKFFADKLIQLQHIIETMPKSYEQDGKGDEAVAYLHYFKGGYDFYITERDIEKEQHQAFGLVSGHEIEMGYISIVELLANNVEIDLHFEPTTLKEIRKNLK